MQEAITLFEQVLTDAVRVLGDDHPTTQTIAENLAAANIQQSDTE